MSMNRSSTFKLNTMDRIQIAIAGVTGQLGTLFADYLLSKPQVEVHGICRNPSKLSKSLASHPQMKVFTIASAQDKAALQSAVTGCNIVICAYLGDNSFMVDAQKILIDVSILAGVPRYMASDYSLDYRGLSSKWTSGLNFPPLPSNIEPKWATYLRRIP